MDNKHESVDAKWCRMATHWAGAITVTIAVCVTIHDTVVGGIREAAAPSPTDDAIEKTKGTLEWHLSHYKPHRENDCPLHTRMESILADLHAMKAHQIKDCRCDNSPKKVLTGGDDTDRIKVQP